MRLRRRIAAFSFFPLAPLEAVIAERPAPPERRGEEPRLVAFVAAESENRVVAVDLRSRRVLARIPVARGPHNVAASVDGRHVIVTSPPAGRVTVISTRTRRVASVFRGFGYPHDVETSGRYAYVTDEARGQVAVLDLARDRVTARVPVGPRPHDLAVADAGWVTHTTSSSSLTILGLGWPGRPRVIARLPARGPAHDIVRQPDSATVYLTYWNSGVVAARDFGRFLFRRDVGTVIHHVAVDYYSANHLWVTDHAGGRTLVLSARDGRTLRSFGGCPGAHHVDIAGPGRAAVACHDSGRLVVFDRARGRLWSIRAGRGLHGVALVPR